MTLPGDGGATRADRIEGVLLGAACGDALGVPYEFGSAPLGRGEVPRMIGGGLGPYAPGEWSDDTQMAVVIARVAADRGLRTVDALDAIVTGWVDWLAAGATDVGTQTRQVLGAVAGEEARRAWSAAASASTGLHHRTGRTAGNGSLMRTGPVALAFLDDPAMLTLAARWVSEATHHDPLAGDACVLWCHAIRLAVRCGGGGRWTPRPQPTTVAGLPRPPRPRAPAASACRHRWLPQRASRPTRRRSRRARPPSAARGRRPPGR